MDALLVCLKTQDPEGVTVYILDATSFKMLSVSFIIKAQFPGCDWCIVLVSLQHGRVPCGKLHRTLALLYFVFLLLCCSSHVVGAS